jgi:hypothetical protein
VRACSKCGEEKPDDQFYDYRKTRIKRCRECHNASCRAYVKANRQRRNATIRARYAAHIDKSREYQRLWRRANPESTKNTMFRKKYGMTLQEWGVMLGKQEGLCSICCKVLDGNRGTHVDHDHVTGKVRSILCKNCNTGLGQFGDNAETLVLAARYLQDHAARAVA